MTKANSDRIWKLNTGACSDEYGNLSDHTLIGFGKDILETSTTFPVSVDARVRIHGDKSKPLPDFPYFSPGSIACRAKLDQRLLDMLAKYGTTFTVTGISEKYIVVVPNTQYDAFCQKSSVYSLFEVENEPETIMHVKEFVLDGSKVLSAPVFRLRGDPAVFQTVFCTDDFKKIVEENKYIGLKFSEVATI